MSGWMGVLRPWKLCPAVLTCALLLYQAVLVSVPSQVEFGASYVCPMAAVVRL